VKGLVASIPEHLWSAALTAVKGASETEGWGAAPLTLVGGGGKAPDISALCAALSATTVELMSGPQHTQGARHMARLASDGCASVISLPERIANEQADDVPSNGVLGTSDQSRSLAWNET
jgi:hypothetical protein